MSPRTTRCVYDSPLGPLQDLGVKGALTFTLANGSAAGKTAITLDMKVTGSSLGPASTSWRPVVDQVLAEYSMKRFVTRPSRLLYILETRA